MASLRIKILTNPLGVQTFIPQRLGSVKHWFKDNEIGWFDFNPSQVIDKWHGESGNRLSFFTWSDAMDFLILKYGKNAVQYVNL